MKKAVVNLFQNLIIVLALVVAACSEDGEEPTTAELLIGTWTTSEIELSSSVGSQSVTEYLIDVVGLSPGEAATQFALFESYLVNEVTGSLTLNSDHTYESDFLGGSDSGTWSLSADETTLTLYEGSEEIVITINSISTSTLNATYGGDLLIDIDNDAATPDVIVTAEATLTLTK